MSDDAPVIERLRTQTTVSMATPAPPSDSRSIAVYLAARDGRDLAPGVRAIRVGAQGRGSGPAARPNLGSARRGRPTMKRAPKRWLPRQDSVVDRWATSTDNRTFDLWTTDPDDPRVIDAWLDPILSDDAVVEDLSENEGAELMTDESNRPDRRGVLRGDQGEPSQVPVRPPYPHAAAGAERPRRRDPAGVSRPAELADR